MSLYHLIALYLRRHWTAYAVSAVMLVGVAVLLVCIPRQIGRTVDGLVAGRLAGAALLQELALLVAAGTVVYFLRVGWRLKLYVAAYRMGVELREKLYTRLTLQGASFFQGSRTGNLMALATRSGRGGSARRTRPRVHQPP